MEIKDAFGAQVFYAYSPNDGRRIRRATAEEVAYFQQMNTRKHFEKMTLVEDVLIDFDQINFGPQAEQPYMD